MYVDAYRVMDQADIPDMLMPSADAASRTAIRVKPAAGAKIRYYVGTSSYLQVRF